MSPTERKLAAILSADVVGYSRLMAEDEAGTIRTLSTYRTVDGQVLFGQNLVHEGRGLVRVGDPVEVLDTAREA